MRKDKAGSATSSVKRAQAVWSRPWWFSSGRGGTPAAGADQQQAASGDEHGGSAHEGGAVATGAGQVGAGRRWACSGGPVGRGGNAAADLDRDRRRPAATG